MGARNDANRRTLVEALWQRLVASSRAVMQETVMQVLQVSLVCLLAGALTLACATPPGECESRSYSSDRPKDFHIDSASCSGVAKPGSQQHERCLRRIGWGPRRPSECDPKYAERRALANACFKKVEKKVPGYSVVGCMKYSQDLFPETSPSLDIQSK